MDSISDHGRYAPGNLILIRDSHTNTDDIELETALQQLALNLGCDAVETNVALWVYGLRGAIALNGSHFE